MITNYFSVRALVMEKPYIDEAGNSYSKSVMLTFCDQFGKELDNRVLGYLELEEIYDRIDQTNEINLTNCYVKGFSITAFRRTRLLKKNDVVKIKSIQARTAFFESNFDIDFSYMEIDGGGVDFSGTHFYGNELSFASCNFGDGKKDFSYCNIKCSKADFSNTKFYDGSVLFKNSTMAPGLKDFQYAHFGEGEVNFTNVEFGGGDVSFINTVFGNGNVAFKVARFGDGKVDFHYAKFGDGDINFERTEFGNGKVDFRMVEFHNGRVNFNRSVFGNGEISFEGAELKNGKFNMKKAEIASGPLIFDLLEFEDSDLFLEKTMFGNGNTTFYNAKINKLSLLGCNLDKYVDLRVNRCNYLDLSDTIVRDIIDFKPFDFDVNIRVLNMKGMRLLGTIYIDWETNRLKEIIYNQGDETTFQSKSDQFLMMKNCFNNIGQYEQGDKAYVEYMRCDSKSMVHDAHHQKSSLFLRKCIYWLKWLTIDQAGYYATSPVRVLLAVGAVYILFSFSYVLLYFISDSDVISTIGDPHRMGLIARSFYHSAITFLTIGYGDHVPLGLARVFSALEGFSGVFLMSYFTVSLVRKILK